MRDSHADNLDEKVREFLVELLKGEQAELREEIYKAEQHDFKEEL
jgi:hypothetical protein